jgi:S-(hydroxymethyl)mycothiol dehydrogenase
VTISVQGVVARGKGEPVELTTVLVPEPGPGEALVTVQACGVCHTDLHYKEGGIGEDFPYLLGHEAAGVVDAVGPDVTDVAPGDFVILNWRAVCGRCRACSRGEPWYCFNTHNATQKMTLEDGTVLSPALGIGAFVEKTLVAAGQCTKVNPAIPAATAGLLGCGVMAGIGAAINTGGVTRGDSVAVIGCGGLGSAAIQGARLAGAHRVFAIDPVEFKLAKAREFGATQVAPSVTEAFGLIREITWGRMCDVVVLTMGVGRADMMDDILALTAKRGRVVVTNIYPVAQGQPRLSLNGLAQWEKQIAGCIFGSVNSRADIPRLLGLYRDGLLDLDGMVTRTYPLEDINLGYQDMRDGKNIRGVLLM